MLSALLLVTFAWSPASAQEQSGSIQGVVKDAQGAVLPGATVEAKNPPPTTSAQPWRDVLPRREWGPRRASLARWGEKREAGADGSRRPLRDVGDILTQLARNKRSPSRDRT